VALKTPGRLRVLLLASVVASLLWGVTATWTAGQRLSAANSVVASSGPLSNDAQQVYQSLSDADATEASSYLSGVEPGPDITRVHKDILQAEASILPIRAGDSDPAIQADLTTLAAGIPNYMNYVGEADAFNREQLLVGAAWLGDASSLMRGTLLPAASDLYGTENARLEGASAQATGFPVVAVVIAVLVGIAALWAQWWLARRTRRVLNRGLVVASVVGVLSLAWLLSSLTVARSDLLSARAQGSAPAQALVQAEITALKMHADESLTLINRGGSSDPSQVDYAKLSPQLGAQLVAAQSVGAGSPGHAQAVAAAKSAQAWLGDHGQVITDVAGKYGTAVHLATAGSSATDFQAMETALARGLAADQATFTSSAASGDDALGALVAGMIVAGLAMAVACAWGVSRRIGEYR
jgi:hypothetical protein